ncbi:hypothetical protein CDAR_573621 [Caerostris darwini]|uniref:Uncharacterized protein n=1 Tax=Caerostris darwini TaxID=1538125 RepID=A0AAV4TC19_9ARAC|nr:hypothetical protein CDAR_573621 [Caerostris darwini]
MDFVPSAGYVTPTWSISFSVLGVDGQLCAYFQNFPYLLACARFEDGFDCSNKGSRSFTRDRYSSMLSVMMALNTSFSRRFTKHMALLLMSSVLTK